MITLPVTSPEKQLQAQKWVLPIAIGLFLLPVLFLEAMILADTNGTFMYPVDDTFIHLAIAKNFAFHGVWGISAHEFASASSSILYPLILTLILKIVGLHTIIPFFVNLIAAILLLIVVRRWLQRQEISPAGQLWVLAGLIFFTPLPILAMSGMEHTIQLLFCFLFIWSFSDSVSKLVASEEKEWTFPWPVFIYAFLLTLTRYEGMTIIGIACLILAAYKRWWLAFQLGFAGFLPILVFGIISLYMGSYFIPNSVLLKSGAPPLTVDGILTYFTDTWFEKLSSSGVGYNMIGTQRLLFILPITYLVFSEHIRKALTYRYILIILMAATLLHLSVAGIVRFPRYEAYLVGCSSIVIGSLIVKYGKQVLAGPVGKAGWVAYGVGILLIYPLFFRSTSAFTNVDTQSQNIYGQQYQMGRFMHNYYYDVPVAFNDIGAVSMMTQGKNVDFWGLGNFDVTMSIKKNYYGPDFLNWLSQKDSVKVAVLFERYFPPQLLYQWDKVASWQVPNNIICADDSVSFYAVDKGAGAALRKHLHDYESSLPHGVTVRYY
jgi:hypothetical protein